MKQIKNGCLFKKECFYTNCKRNPNECDISIRKRAKELREADDRYPGQVPECMS